MRVARRPAETQPPLLTPVDLLAVAPVDLLEAVPEGLQARPVGQVVRLALRAEHPPQRPQPQWVSLSPLTMLPIPSFPNSSPHRI